MERNCSPWRKNNSDAAYLELLGRFVGCGLVANFSHTVTRRAVQKGEDLVLGKPL